MECCKEIYFNINKFNENNITYIKPISFFKQSRSMGIYYNEEIEPQSGITQRQKIIIRSPKMMVPFPIKIFDHNGKKNILCLYRSVL